MNINLRNLFGSHHDDIINCRKRYLVCKGSRGSGKTTTVFRMIIMRMLWYWNVHKICPSVLVMRQWACTHNSSTFIEVQKAIDALKVNHLFRKTKSPMMYIHIPSGAQIIFKGMDDAMKITGVNANTPLTWIVCEESFEIKSEDEFDRLNMSIRGIIPDCLFYQTIMMFNPWSDKHWLKKRFFDTNDDDVLAITKTYRDNEFLDEQFIKDMEKLKINNPKKYRIVGDGEFGIAEGLVFENWVVQPFDYAKMLTAKSYLNTNKFRDVYGLDFGWTDPTTVIASLVNDDNKELFIYNEIYESNLTIANLAKKIKANGWQNKPIMCDSANPREIQLLKTEGISGAKPAYKGQNSIMAGIKLLQDYKIVIHPNCKHTIEEFSLYTWETEKQSGKFLDTPIDDHNHLLDSLRYSMLTQKATFY